MHVAVRPYVTTGLALVGAAVIAVTPIAPAVPTAGAATVLPTEPATVLTVSPIPQIVALFGNQLFPPDLYPPEMMQDALQGALCQGTNDCVQVDYPFLQWSSEGPRALNDAINATSDPVVVFGYSQGAALAGRWLEEYADAPDAPPREKLSFVLMGNLTRAYGGNLASTGQVMPQTQYRDIDISQQYDFFSDYPTDPFNVFALANALAGALFIHGDYTRVNPDDPANAVWTVGNTTYILVPTEDLPLLIPLQSIGLGALADALNGPLKAVVELGYNRPVPFGTTTTGPVPPPASILNSSANLINAIANIPAYEIQALQRLTEALNFGGSWWLYTPNNLLGWGPADPELIKGLVDTVLPFPALSRPLGEQINMWAAANLPMNAGCTGLPPCPDPLAILNSMFRVSIWDLISGYTFPTIINPLDGTEAEWSGETVYLDPLAPARSVMNYLTAAPSGIMPVSPQTAITTVTNLFAALDVAFNPFIPDSYCLICRPDGLEEFVTSIPPMIAAVPEAFTANLDSITSAVEPVELSTSAVSDAALAPAERSVTLAVDPPTVHSATGTTGIDAALEAGAEGKGQVGVADPITKDTSEDPVDVTEDAETITPTEPITEDTPKDPVDPPLAVTAERPSVRGEGATAADPPHAIPAKSEKKSLVRDSFKASPGKTSTSPTTTGSSTGPTSTSTGPTSPLGDPTETTGDVGAEGTGEGPSEGAGE